MHQPIQINTERDVCVQAAPARVFLTDFTGVFLTRVMAGSARGLASCGTEIRVSIWDDPLPLATQGLFPEAPLIYGANFAVLLGNLGFVVQLRAVVCMTRPL